MLLPQKQKLVRTSNNRNQNQNFAERIKNKYLQTGAYPFRSVSFIWRQGSNAGKYAASDSLMVNLKLILETKGADHQKTGGRLFRHSAFLTGSQGVQFFTSSLEKALRPFLLNQQAAGKNNKVSNTRDSLNESTSYHITDNKTLLTTDDRFPAQVYLAPEGRAVLLREPWILDRFQHQNALKTPVIKLPGAGGLTYIVPVNFGSGPEQRMPKRGLVPAGNNIRGMISRPPQTTGAIARTRGERYGSNQPGSALPYKINRGISLLRPVPRQRTGLAPLSKDTSIINYPPNNIDDYKEVKAEYYKFNNWDVPDTAPEKAWPHRQEADGTQHMVQPSPNNRSFRHRIEIYRPRLVKRILSAYTYHPSRQTLTPAGQRTIQRRPTSAATRSYRAINGLKGDTNIIPSADTFGAAGIFRLINRTWPGADTGRSISPWSAVNRLNGSGKFETRKASSVIRPAADILNKLVTPVGRPHRRNDYAPQLPAGNWSGTEVIPVNMYFGQPSPNSIRAGIGSTELNRNRDGDHQVRAAVPTEWFYKPIIRPNGHTRSASQGKENLLTASDAATRLADFTVGIQRHSQGLAKILTEKQLVPAFKGIEQTGRNIPPSSRPAVKDVTGYPAPEYPESFKPSLSAPPVLGLRNPLWAISTAYKVDRSRYAADQRTPVSDGSRGRTANSFITDRYNPVRSVDTPTVNALNVSEPQAAVTYDIKMAKKLYWLKNQTLGQPEIEIYNQQKYKPMAKPYPQQNLTTPSVSYIQRQSITSVSGDNRKAKIGMPLASAREQRLVPQSRTYGFQRVAPGSGVDQRLGLTLPPGVSASVNPARVPAKWPNNVLNIRNTSFPARLNPGTVPAGSPLSVGSQSTAAMIQRQAVTNSISPTKGRYSAAEYPINRWRTNSQNYFNGIISRKNLILDQPTSRGLTIQRKAGNKSISRVEGGYSTAAEYPANRRQTRSLTSLYGMVSRKTLMPDQRTGKELASWLPDLSVRLLTMPGGPGRKDAPPTLRESQYSAGKLTFSQAEPVREVSSLTGRRMREETSPIFNIRSGAAAYPTMIRNKNYISTTVSADHRQLKRNHSGRGDFSRYLGAGRPTLTASIQEQVTLKPGRPADFYQDATYPGIQTGTHRELASTGQQMAAVPIRGSDDLNSTAAHANVSSKADHGVYGNRFNEKLLRRTYLGSRKNEAIGASRKHSGITTSYVERPGYNRAFFNTDQEIIRHRGIKNIDKGPSSYSTMGAGVGFDYRRNRSIPAEIKPNVSDSRTPTINNEFMVQLPEARNVEFNSTEIRKIADRVYREIEQRMKRDRQHRGL